MLATTLNYENHDVLEPLVEEDERTLLTAVADGDRLAFEKVFRLYHPRVFKFAIRMTKDPQQAEEVACDTLYAVWTGVSKFRWQSSVSTWILGIAYKQALKSYRKNARHTQKREPDYQMHELEEPDPSRNPESYTSNRIDCDRLSVAMDTLSCDHRAVIELTAQGFSCSEIADIVQCPENTVKTRTFHARRKLRLFLQE